MLRSWLLGGLCAVALASTSASLGGIVETRDGRTIEGDVTETPDQVIIDRHGMRFAIDRSEVKSISKSNSVIDEYNRRHEKLAPSDVRGRIDLARWLLDKKEYDLARQLLMEARQFSMRNPEVIAMQQAVDRQQDLDMLIAKKKGPVQLAALDNAAVPPTTSPASRPARAPDAPIRPLTADEINLIRQDELTANETIHATFKGDVRRQFAATVRDQITPADFNRLTPAQQAAAILRDGSADMKAGVIITQDPTTLKQFKTIQRAVLSVCASCHTNGKTKSHFAIIWPATNDATTYANFLLLSKYSTKVGDREYRMIDRASPSDSLLLLYAVPPMNVVRNAPAHPTADGKYKGLPTSQLPFKQLDEWLTQTINPQSPDYNMIDVGPAAPAPAAKK